MKKNLKERVVAFVRARERGKRWYGKADEMLEDLLKDLAVGDAVEIGGGRQVELVDNFAKGNKAWGHGSVNRFDLKVSKVPEPAAAAK